MPNIIDTINTRVIEKTKEYHNIYIENKNILLQKEKKNIEENFEKTKKDIIDCLSVIKSKDLQEQNILEEKKNELKELNINYLKYTSKKEILLYLLEIKTKLKENTYFIQIKNKNNNKNEKIEFTNKTRYILLQDSIFNINDIEDFTIFIKDDYTKKINIKDKIIKYIYKMNIFTEPIVINQKVKNILIKSAENNINLFESRITFNGEEFNKIKLDNFIKAVNNFNEKILGNIKLYDERFKEKLIYLIDIFDNMEEYLNLATSNGKENDNELERNVKDLKNLVVKCIENLKLNLNDVNKIINLNKKIEGDNIFILDHNKQVVLYKEPQNKEQFYISNLSYLKYPMISDNGKNITFSSKSFQMFLGSYIPSILQSPIIIKILNIKENKLKVNIKDCNKNIITVDDSDYENTLKIYINVQSLKSEKLYKEDIQFKLEINSFFFNKLLIPFNLNLNIIPLSILFSLENYKLNYDKEKNEFSFNSPIVYSNSKIKFFFKYLYKSNFSQLNNNTVTVDYSLDSLEKNNSIKPVIDIKKNKLILEIPKYEDNQNNIINFLLKIYFTSTFYINIKYNSIIYPFDFDLKWYSYNKKKFTTDKIELLIDEENIDYKYIIYFKTEKTPIKTDFEFKFKKPNEFLVNNLQILSININNECLFSIEVKILKKPKGYYQNFYFSVIGNKIEKKICISPKIIKKKTNILKDLLDLPKYKYNQINKTFTEEFEIEKESIYITPFNYYIPFVYNLYPSKNSSIIDPIYEPNFDFFLICYSYELKKFVKIEFKNRDKYNEIIEIIGIFNDDKWYPIKIMDNKNDIFKSFKYLEYNEEEIENAKEMIEKIDDKNDYWHIPIIVKNFCNPNPQSKYKFLQFINILPSSIKNEIHNEYLKINSLNNDGNDNDNFFDKYYPIVSNNLIFSLYKVFKNKYSEIKKNNGVIYLNDVKPPSDILDKIKEKRNEYFNINKNEILNFEDEFNFKENKNDYKNDGNNMFLLQENKNPEIIDNLNQITLEEEEIEMKQLESEKFDISDISLMELKYPLNNSINEIIQYYNNCTKITNILYFYIIAASKSNNIERQLIAGDYYQKLSSIANKFKNKDYCFFSMDINDFLNGFNTLCGKLGKIGCKLGEKKISSFSNNEMNYIIWPKEKGINKDKDNWTTKQNFDNIKYKQEDAQIGKLRSNVLKNEEYFVEDIESEEEEEAINNCNNEKINLIDGEVDIEKIKIIDIDNDKYDIIYKDEDDNIDNKSENDNNKIESDKKIKIGKKADNLTYIDPIKISEKNFNEEDGIKRALMVLEEEKRKKQANNSQNFDLGNNIKKCHKFHNMSIFKIGNNKILNIQKLYDNSSFLANQLFIKINGNGKIKYFDTLVIILVDPSVYISEEIKILNMFIICAMANALNCLEIKYSIVLMGDEDFRCVLKDYNEPHSIEALERVYECLILKRFRTNIPGCLKYCLEEISSKSNFKYTSFFIFTDGLDKRFIYTQKNTWDTNIFYKKTNSFGFIFLLSSILTIKNKEFLNEIWNTFINETKINSHSGIFLKSLELKIDEKFKKNICDIFILNLIRSKNEEPSNEIKYNKPIFTVKYDNYFLNNINTVLDDKSLFNLNGSYIKNDIISSSLNTKKEAIDTNCFKNNLHQMAKIINIGVGESEKNLINLAHKFLSIRANLNKGILDEIFKPNKANLKVLSNSGTEIDIMALILYFLNPVPEPMIYLQDAIGNIKEYAITIIIDTSYSVLNHMNINHSINTIRVLLSSFTIIDLPSFDLIVTGEEGPIVLCSEYPTFAALNEKSKLWELLLRCLSNPISNADLLSSIQTAFDLKRMRTNNFPSYLFVLTDGLFEEDKQDQLKEIIAKLTQTNIQVIGIGLGIYPYGINNIFGQAIFDINPNNLLNSILSILEGNINDTNEMNYIQKEEESEKNILSTISKLIQNKKYNYMSLREELKNSPLTINCYDMLTDEVTGGYDELGRPINPKGDKIGLLKENSLMGQQILIVMLWSCALSATEKYLLDPKYIHQTNEKNSKCIANSVDYLGVKIKTVLNYEDAIKEITKKDKDGRCNYYTVWVMCGPDINQLPDRSKYPGLVEQFIDCLILYWQNGGAVVLFCDNEPLYFQANMFLEKVRFKKGKEKTNLRITGNDPGQNVLRGYIANGNLTMNSIYDAGIFKLPNGTERMPLGRNTPQIYEGETISHSNSNFNEDIKPFIPFAKNSSGNICIMLYCTQGKEGDIIIDCGYTKAFINMSTEDIATWRYIQNIAGFLARPEAHMIYDDGETAKNYRPNGINFNIDYYKLYTKLQYYDGRMKKFSNESMFSIMILDVSGSMEGYYNDLIDMANQIITNQMKNSKNQGIIIFFANNSKTIINKYYRPLYINDIDNANVGKGTNFKKGFDEAYQYLDYGYNFNLKRVLFLTDGEDYNYYQIGNTCERMKSLGYKIYIIGFGNCSTFQDLKPYASEGCFNTNNLFEQVKEICIQAFAS